MLDTIVSTCHNGCIQGHLPSLFSVGCCHCVPRCTIRFMLTFMGSNQYELKHCPTATTNMAKRAYNAVTMNDEGGGGCQPAQRKAKCKTATTKAQAEWIDSGLGGYCHARHLDVRTNPMRT